MGVGPVARPILVPALRLRKDQVSMDDNGRCRMPLEALDVSDGAHNPKVVPSNPILHDPLSMHALEAASVSTFHRRAGNRLIQSQGGWRFIPESALSRGPWQRRGPVLAERGSR